MSRLTRRLIWGLGAILSLLIGLVVSRYFTLDPEVFFPEQREAYLGSLPTLLAHIGGGVVALVVGPAQLAKGLRARAPRLHRVLGVAYAAAVAVGGSAGLILAPNAHGGWPSTMGFGCLAVLWLGTTVTAIAFISRGRLADHRRWMLRSFALTFAAVTLRMWLPLLDGPIGLDFVSAYRSVAWLAWVPNLLLVEWFLRSESAG